MRAFARCTDDLRDGARKPRPDWEELLARIERAQSFTTGGDDRDSSNVLSILEGSMVDGTGALAWAGNRVKVSATGESIRISKFEGEFTSREIGNQIDNNPGEEVIKTTSPEGHH